MSDTQNPTEYTDDPATQKLFARLFDFRKKEAEAFKLNDDLQDEFIAAGPEATSALIRLLIDQRLHAIDAPAKAGFPSMRRECSASAAIRRQSRR